MRKVKAVLEVEITYELPDGLNEDLPKTVLLSAVNLLASQGLLSGESEMEVLTWQAQVSTLVEKPAEPRWEMVSETWHCYRDPNGNVVGSIQLEDHLTWKWVTYVTRDTPPGDSEHDTRVAAKRAVEEWYKRSKTP